MTFCFTGKYHGQAGGLETGGSSDFDSGECAQDNLEIETFKNIFAAVVTILMLHLLSHKCACKPLSVLDKLNRYSVYI